MSAVIAVPEMMASAATDLATIGSNVSAAHMVAAVPTLSVLPAAADEVSAGIAHLFSQHAANYQALAGQAAAFHEQFVQHLTAGAFSYAGAEAVDVASLLQPLTTIPGLIGGAVTAFWNELVKLMTDLVTNIVAFISGWIQAIAFVLLYIPLELLFIAFVLYLAANGVSLWPPYNI